MEPAAGHGQPGHVPDHGPGPPAGRSGASTCRPARSTGWSTERPERLSLKVLMALLDILDCSMEDLIEPSPRPRRPARRRRPAGRRPGSGNCVRGGPGSPGRRLSGDRGHPGRAGRPGRRHRCDDQRRRAVPGTGGDRGSGDQRRRRPGQAAQARPGARRRPAILADGRSPAPRVAGDLLVALRKAGAGAVSPPVCAGCGKQLRSIQRRGEDWFCAACGPKREPCAGCGKVRVIHLRDRDGGPRCAQVPARRGSGGHRDGRRRGDRPGAAGRTVAAAVTAAAAQAGQRHQLAWALQDRPELLTGEGAAAPVPSVLRLIDKLVQAGAKGIVRPPCPHCGRVIPLVKPRGGVRLCRNCVARSRAEPCSRCGTVREAATRDKDGRPLCPHCLITDPANQETCAGCRRRRPVSVRTPEGPLCPSCRPWQTATCGICGREAPCVISQATGEPWCGACRQRWARCSRLRPDRPRPRRHQGRAALRYLHPTRCRLLAQLPGLRRDRPDPRRPLRPVRHRPAAA